LIEPVLNEDYYYYYYYYYTLYLCICFTRVQFAGCSNTSNSTSTEKEEPSTERGPVASVATDASQTKDMITSSTADNCLPPSADDDERSLDENLRPMDGQIWLPDVDGGISDAFQTAVNILLYMAVSSNVLTTTCLISRLIH